MRHSEFWRVVDEVLGERYGRSVAADLVLQELGSRTAVEALEAGLGPQRVWDAVCTELDLGEVARWHHRVDEKDRRHRS